MDSPQEENVGLAFSRQAQEYDKIDLVNPVVRWMRTEVRNHMLSILKPGNKILELNAGSGLDAVFFAEQGFSVHATDNAPGMINAIKEKVHFKNLHDKITIQTCSLNRLEEIEQGKYNYVFSNFGGINCIQDIKPLIANIDRLLPVKGFITLVVLPPICPIELMLALKGNFKVAFRRLKKDGTESHLNGVYFKTYYYSPEKIIKQFGSNYKLVSLRGLGITVPPPYLDKHMIKHPKIFRFLTSIEKYICQRFPFNRWGDYSIISLQKIR